MRIYIISDIHIDFSANHDWLKKLSSLEYQDDALILAGDVSHNFDQFRRTLSELRIKFKHLFFVPGNHDLWIRSESWQDSLHKFQEILQFCDQNEIIYRPHPLNAAGSNAPLIVPLFSWYTQPDEGEESLYLEKPGEDAGNRMWSDNYFVKWPNHSPNIFRADKYFTGLNAIGHITKSELPVISFSHFLPRQEMMFSADRHYDLQRMKKYDRNPPFNFSRVAGSTLIEKQIRQIKSRIHIYGHQHINRDRVIDGVRYVAHCLGYPNERSRGSVKGLEQGLKLIWDTNRGENDRPAEDHQT